eukprot:scaffold59793_cov81-Phaeocystis_antarctica.AAC.1
MRYTTGTRSKLCCARTIPREPRCWELCRVIGGHICALKVKPYKVPDAPGRAVSDAVTRPGDRGAQHTLCRALTLALVSA